MENLTIQQQASPDFVQELNKAEIDIQIATAKQYPRDVLKALDDIRAYSMLDEETMESCFYRLERKDKNGETKEIEGLSVRMAEIFVTCWGNVRAAMRIISNDGKKITAQGICFDLEKNVAVTTEVSRRITTSNGRTYSDDMQVITGNAAAAIAFRNAVFKVIPKALTKRITDDIKKALLENTKGKLETKRNQILAWYRKLGVTDNELRRFLGADDLGKLTAEQVMDLRATAVAIKEGSTSVEEAFRSAESSVEEAKEMMRSKSQRAVELP